MVITNTDVCNYTCCGVVQYCEVLCSVLWYSVVLCCSRLITEQVDHVIVVVRGRETIDHFAIAVISALPP
jgi:hypothetical protein